MKRKSNIELLRIVAMCMIISVHYFAYSNIGIKLNSEVANYKIFLFVESLGICGVNLFILITGYFSIKQTAVKLRKIVNLLVDIAFWGSIGYLISVLVGWKNFNLIEWIKIAIPFITGGRWFVKEYIVLLLLIPFVNCIINSIDKNSYKKLLIIFLLLFSIWPSFFPYPPLDDYGYGFVHFVFLYLISGYIKLHITKMPRKMVCFSGYVISAIAVWGSRIVGNGYAWAYNSLFVIFEAVFLFLLFAQMDFQSKYVNFLASCAFGVFLIHTDGFFSVLIYDKVFHANDVMLEGAPLCFLLNIVVCVPVFYIVGFILEYLKQKFFTVSIDKLLDHVPFINQLITINQK